MAYSRNEVMAGAVITASVITGAFVTYFVGNFKDILKEKENITVFFKSVTGLKPGDPVLYAGIDAGNVHEIRTAEVKTSAVALDAFAKLPDVERYILSKPRLPVLCTKEGTGDIYTVAHDAGLVYLPGRKPYAIAVLTEWEPTATGRSTTIAAASYLAYAALITDRADVD